LAPTDAGDTTEVVIERSVAGAMETHGYFNGGTVNTVRTLVVKSTVTILVMLGLLAVCLPGPGWAQEIITRKVKSRVTPSYPEMARRFGISGTVKLAVVIAPNGTVKTTTAVGGHPVLVNAAMEAVKKWKYEQAGGESTGTVEIKFAATE